MNHSNLGFWYGRLAITLPQHSATYGASFEKRQCFWYVTDKWLVYPMFIKDTDHLVSKIYMTPVEGENTRLRLTFARVTPSDIVLLQVC